MKSHSGNDVRFHVAYKHYLQENVLLRSLNADEQRKQLANDPYHQASEHLEGLKKLGLTERALDAVRAVVEKKFAPLPVPANATWTAEDMAVGSLQKQWRCDVSARMVRRHFRNLGALDYTGERGRAHYRDDVLNDLLSRDPIEIYIGDDVESRQRTAFGEQFGAVRIGSLLLVRREDAPNILRSLRERNGSSHLAVPSAA